MFSLGNLASVGSALFSDSMVSKVSDSFTEASKRLENSDKEAGIQESAISTSLADDAFSLELSDRA